MDSFFQSIKSALPARDALSKKTLLDWLQDAVRQINYDYSQRSSENDALQVCDATSNLCSTIEAMFLHGLKSSLLRSALNALSDDADRKPSPNFWPALLIISHRQTIKHLQSLSQMRNEIGYCRAWIRQALNDGLISSYLSNIKSHSHMLNDYYQRSSFLRDNDALELATQFIESSEVFAKISLPINSSLYNRWPDEVLQLAGLWTPPLRSVAIIEGVEVSTADNSVDNDTIIEQIEGNENANSLTQYDNKPITSIDQLYADMVPAMVSDQNVDRCLNIETSLLEGQMPANSVIGAVGNSITRQMSWQPNENLPQIDLQSFSTIILQQEHNTQARIDANKVAVNVWRQFEETIAKDQLHQWSVAETQSSNENNNNENSDSDSFEIINTQDILQNMSRPELQTIVDQLCRLANERGLDAQDFLCADCQSPLGIGFQKAQICAFSGSYFCNECIHTELTLIPARIIFNWDFQRYAIGKRYAQFLSVHSMSPFIDMATINPAIYENISEMANLRNLRTRLEFLNTYLVSCTQSSQSTATDLAPYVWTREYLIEYVHRYAITDLCELQYGNLYQRLLKVLNYARSHVLNCGRCSQNGFVCEVCTNIEDVLYPFDIDGVYRCKECCTMFHLKCIKTVGLCPKCKRMRLRHSEQ